MKKNINSFLINAFEFENKPCICKKEPIYTSPNMKPKYNLKICADSSANNLKFSYAPQKGLSLTGNAGGVIEENILGKLLAIPSNDLNETIQFIEKYGFIFPISDSEFESINANALLTFFERLKETVLLMSDIARKKNFNSIFTRLTYLLFSDGAVISTLTKTYSTKIHSFTHKLQTYSATPDIHRNQELLDFGYISVIDSVQNKTVTINRDYLVSMVEGNEIQGLCGSKDPRFKKLFALYSNYQTNDRNLRKIIDFYFNYQNEVGVIDSVEPNKINFYEKKNAELSDELKIAMLEVAKIVISDEVNENISNIHPTYSYGSLAPSWKLTSLLEALYLSVFYMKPEVELYKECENPNCKRNKYFLVKTTKQNKKYCCKECANAAAQRRSRQRMLDK